MRPCSYRHKDGSLCLADAGTDNACAKHLCESCGFHPYVDEDDPVGSLGRRCSSCYNETIVNYY